MARRPDEHGQKPRQTQRNAGQLESDARGQVGRAQQLHDGQSTREPCLDGQKESASAMKAKYKISEVFSPRGVCHLQKIKNVPDWAYMHKGVPQAGKFPRDAYFQMSPDFPKDIKLADT